MKDHEREDRIFLYARIGMYVGIGIFFFWMIYSVIVPALENTKDRFEPNGNTTQVEILNTYMKSNIFYDTRMCIYEVEGARHELSDCLYEQGEKITLYQVNGGMWYLQKPEQN